jgi:hypothetical protein
MAKSENEKTVTVTTTQRTGLPRFTVRFSALPNRVFGPYNFTETAHDLHIAALLSLADARNLILDAHSQGSATRVVG